MEVTDDRGARVRLEAPPRRVVSLVPSATETLFDLGLPVVGVTRFCVHPADRIAGLPKIGGTKDVDVERVRSLTPDLIVGNCEENTREIFDALGPVAPLYAAFPRDVDGALHDLQRLAALTGADAAPWVARATAARARLHAARRAPRRVAALIWREPWMAAGSDTFIHAMLTEAGLENHFGDRPERFPTFEPEALRGADLVLLLSEPFPFRRRHAEELAQRSGLPVDRLRAVDGEHLTWHGTRMIQGLDALAHHLTHGWPLP
jgi:ABC-type Fe3+-hydroxamate transport system substrate-binding protein